jgi:hypothetical protein
MVARFFVLAGLAVFGFLLTVVVPRAKGPREVRTTHVEPTQVRPVSAGRNTSVQGTGVVEAG